MNSRPTSVTVIAWFLIIAGCISLVMTAAMTNNPQTQEFMSKSLLPIAVQYALNYAGALVSLVCGIAMLKGLNWGRVLYVVWSILGFVVAFATSPMKMILLPSAVLVLVIIILLFRPKANEYFLPAEVPSDAQSI